MFYQKLNAKHWQSNAADHAEWALDYLLAGDLDNARKMQALSAEYAQMAREEMDVV